MLEQLLILDATTEDKGIKAINMLTSGFGSDYCRSYHPDDEIGGFGMKTKSKNLLNEGVKLVPEVFAVALNQSNNELHKMLYIMHQISQPATELTRSTIMHSLNQDNIPEFYTNFKELGNTATTTHTLALAKAIRDGKVKDNDDVAFLIQASGITIGAAIVGLGDLPSRMKIKKQTLQLRAKKASKTDEDLIIYLRRPMLELKRLSVLENREQAVNDHIARTCQLLDFDSPKNISTFIHTSQYRQEFSEEPSQAAIIMDKLNIMGTAENMSFGFDIIRGASSFLPSILSASAIGEEIEKDIIISSGEYLGRGTEDLNLSNVSTACLLSQSKGKGFSAISFHDYPHLENKLKSRFYTPKPAHLAVSICPKYELYLMACIEDALDRRRKLDLKDISDFDYYILPQRSKNFIERLARKLKLDLAKCIISCDDKDHFSSSVPMAISKLPTDKKDAKALIIEAGSGICVNIGIYEC